MRIRQYFIVSRYLDTFIVSVQQKDRPNNIDDDEAIQMYMHNNYCSTEYEVIEINTNDYENVIL